jgi:hypothetical protein
MTTAPPAARPESEARQRRREAATALRIVSRVADWAAGVLMADVNPSTSAAAARQAEADLARVARLLHRIAGQPRGPTPGGARRAR